MTVSNDHPALMPTLKVPTRQTYEESDPQINGYTTSYGTIRVDGRSPLHKIPGNFFRIDNNGIDVSQTKINQFTWKRD